MTTDPTGDPIPAPVADAEGESDGTAGRAPSTEIAAETGGDDGGGQAGLPPDESRWVDVAPARELRRQRTRVVAGPDGEVAVFWNDGRPTAMANVCVHRERELARGTIFGGRVICPGHQWAFDVEDGYCKERERTQPVYAARVVDDVVQVDPTRPVNADLLARTEPAGEPSDDPRDTTADEPAATRRESPRP